jgi:hypothetical protein
MKSFISSLPLASGLAFGLVATHFSAAQAVNWTFEDIAPSQDCYLNSQQANTSFCSQDYIMTGFNGGSGQRQNIYMKYDLSSVLADLQAANLSDSAFVKVISARFFAIQDSDAPNTINPNNNWNNTGQRNSLTFPPVYNTAQRITNFRARETLTTWNQTDPNFNYNNRPTLSTTSLFSGGIAAQKNGQTTNIYTGANLNIRLAELINQGLSGSLLNPTLSFAMESTSGLNLASQGFFPIDGFQSLENPNGTPMLLDLELAVFDKMGWDAFARAGSQPEKIDDWEAAVRDKTNNDRPLVQTDFDWLNENDADRIRFELNYDNTTGQVTLILYTGTNNNIIKTITYDTDPDNLNIAQLEGVKLYAKVQTAYCAGNNPASGQRVSPGTGARLVLESITDTNNNVINILPVDSGTADPRVLATSPVGTTSEDAMILAFQDRGVNVAKQLKGTMAISWTGVNPQDSCGGLGGKSRVQMLIEPLTTIPQPVITSAPAPVASDVLGVSTEDIGGGVTPNDEGIQSTPEPSSVLGLALLGLGGLGVNFFRNRK